MSTLEVEPGAAPESGLVTTDTLDNFDEMSCSLEEIKNINPSIEDEESNDNAIINEHFDETVSNDNEVASVDDDFELNKDWIGKDKHVFVLSMAGKPIYSR